LRDNIAQMPLYPYFKDIKVIPLIPHPKFPQFALRD
jgi:hypothetical protein